jgi:hypothetical protein
VTTRHFWIGSTGPFKYDPDERVLDTNEKYGSTPPPFQAPLVGDSLGGGYVIAPSSSTHAGIAGFDGTSGTKIESSTAEVNYAGDIDQPNSKRLLTSGVKFRTSFSLSADVNTLDAYEEGTWTPVVRWGTTSQATTLAVGYYTRIGRVYNCIARITLSGTISGVGDATISLPVASAGGNRQTPCPFVTGSGLTYVGVLFAFVGSGLSAVYLGDMTEGGTASPLNQSNFAASTEIGLQCTYEV